MGVACGPGFPLQVLAFPAHNPTRAVGFTLQSLTRPPHTIAKIYFTYHHGFFQVFPDGSLQ